MPNLPWDQILFSFGAKFHWNAKMKVKREYSVANFLIFQKLFSKLQGEKNCFGKKKKKKKKHILAHLESGHWF